MKVVVTGGLGVIGSRCVEIFQSSGDSVVILDSGEAPRNKWVWLRLQRLKGVELVRRRIESMTLDELVDIFSDSSLIVHAAASTGIPYSTLSPHDDWDCNVEATRRLLDAVRELPICPSVVVLSSVKPYGLGRLKTVERDRSYTVVEGQGVDETFPLEPDEPYAASKAAQSMLCLAYAKSYKLPVTVFRCSNLYGPAPCHGPRHGWLTWFCISAVIGRPIEIQGSGKQTRDMLFADDVVRAVVMAKGLTTPAIYNLGGGVERTISVLDAVCMLEQILGRSILVQYTPGRSFEDALFVTDFSRFHRTTGWAPLVHVSAGVQRIVQWASEHKDDLVNLYQDV